MSSFGVTKRSLKRRARDGPRAKMSQLPDLNSLPVEAGGGASASSSAHVSRGETSGLISIESPQVAPPPQQPNLGMNCSPIDVEAIDDDVVIYSSRWFPQARYQSTRREPVTVILDDDSEANPGPTGDAIDEHVTTLLSLGMNPRHEHLRIPRNNPIINLLDAEESNSVKRSVIEPNPEPAKVVPKEPKFTCPVCMNELVDASSTICGHIFCQKCIKAAIQAQKKCPTCRRKLTMNNFHRVYLPTTE